MIAGFLLPPLAVLIRFGFGKDFAINVLCTICGYSEYFHEIMITLYGNFHQCKGE